MIYWYLFLVQFICVCIVDVLGAVDEMLTPLVKRLTGSKIGHIGKPLNCSTCLTWWIGLFYILFAGEFTLPNIAYVLALSVLTPVTYLVICTIKDTATKIIDCIYSFLGL